MDIGERGDCKTRRREESPANNLTHHRERGRSTVSSHAKHAAISAATARSLCTLGKRQVTEGKLTSYICLPRSHLQLLRVIISPGLGLKASGSSLDPHACIQNASTARYGLLSLRSTTQAQHDEAQAVGDDFSFFPFPLFSLRHRKDQARLTYSI